MKNKIRLDRFTFVIIGMSLLINACNLNLSDNGVAVGPTSTPTAFNPSVENDPTATSAPEEAPTDSSVPSEPKSFNVCGFFTAADAEPIVGTALIEVTQGSDVDEATGGPMNYCTYKGDDVALVLSVVESYAVKDSAEWQGQLMETIKGSQPDALLTASADLGEQAYWMVLEHAAGWNVAKFPYIFALVVGGNIGYSEDYKEDLHALAQRVADSLP